MLQSYRTIPSFRHPPAGLLPRYTDFLVYIRYHHTHDSTSCSRILAPDVSLTTNMSSMIQPKLEIASRRWLMTEVYDELRLARCRGCGDRLVTHVHNTTRWARASMLNWVVSSQKLSHCSPLRRNVGKKRVLVRLSRYFEDHKISTGCPSAPKLTELRNASPAPNAAKTYSESSADQRKRLDAVLTHVSWVHEFYCAFSPILALCCERQNSLRMFPIYCPIVSFIAAVRERLTTVPLGSRLDSAIPVFPDDVEPLITFHSSGTPRSLVRKKLDAVLHALLLPILRRTS